MHVFERGWLSANNILFTDGEQTVLVDSGYCTHAEQTLSLLEGVLKTRPLDVLVNTHLHSDHCGGNAALQRRYNGLTTFIPPGQAAYVANWDPVALTYLPTGQLCPAFEYTKTLQPGSQIQMGAKTWEIHSAAGHDPHSVVFYAPDEKILLSADALWENGFGVVFPELEGEEAFAEVASTLELIERLNPRVVIPGHGRVFSYTPQILALARQRLDALVEDPLRHAQHAAKVLLKFKLLETQQQPFEDFLKWAEATPYLMQIRETFFADTPSRAWVTELCDALQKAGVSERINAYICNK